MPLIAILILLAPIWSDEVLAVETLKLGGSGLTWHETSLDSSGLTLVGNVLTPTEIDSTENLLKHTIRNRHGDSTGVADGTKGTAFVTLFNRDFGELKDIFPDLTDGRLATGWRVYDSESSNGAELNVALDGAQRLHRIRLNRGTDPDDEYLKTQRLNPDDFSLRGYELFVATQAIQERIFSGTARRDTQIVDHITGTIKDSIITAPTDTLDITRKVLFTLLHTDPDHGEPELDVRFAPRSVRFIKLRSTTPDYLMLMGDLEVFGIGIATSASYQSEIFDLGMPANFGTVDVFAHTNPSGAPGTRVELVTRSSSSPRTTLYFQPTQVPGVLIEISEDEIDRSLHGTYGAIEVKNTPEELAKRHNIHRLSDFSRWSRAYPSLPAPLSSPSPRQWVQFDLEIKSDGLSGRAVVDSLVFEYSVPAIADSVIGEISPGVVELGETTEFTYHLRSVFSPTWRGRGFDTVFITTPFEAAAIEVRVEGTPVPFDPRWIPSSSQLRIQFDGGSGARSEQQVEVDFRSLITVAGTVFRGAVDDCQPGAADECQSDAFNQVVLSGDASDLAESNSLAVSARLDPSLFARIELSSPVVTPNGDGANDTVTLDYILLKATDPVRVRARVYDLAGRQVRELKDDEDLSGPETVLWDGMDDRRALVPPGLYLLRLTVESDDGEQTYVHPLAVVY